MNGQPYWLVVMPTGTVINFAYHHEMLKFLQSHPEVISVEKFPRLS